MAWPVIDFAFEKVDRDLAYVMERFREMLRSVADVARSVRVDALEL